MTVINPEDSNANCSHAASAYDDVSLHIVWARTFK